MRVLYEWIKESTPEELWDSFQISDRFATPEGVKAFMKVYKRVLKAKPARGPYVLEKVETEEDFDGRGQLVVIDCNGNRNVHMPISRNNLKSILGIYIPEKLYFTIRITVINLIFRSLVIEELEKPKYENMRIRRKLTEELSANGWKEKYQFNSDFFQLAMDMYDVKVLEELVQNDVYRAFPEIGRTLYWDELVRYADYSEEFCRSLYPVNPPSYLQFRKAVGEIHKHLVMQGMDMIRASRARERALLAGEMTDEIALGDTIKKRIIVEKNYIPGVGIPIIYIVNGKGRRQEIQPGTLEHLADYAVIVRDERWHRDYRTMIGYIILYLTYPLRMYREMKALQIQEIAYLLKERSSGNRQGNET